MDSAKQADALGENSLWLIHQTQLLEWNISCDCTVGSSESDAASSSVFYWLWHGWGHRAAHGACLAVIVLQCIDDAELHLQAVQTQRPAVVFGSPGVVDVLANYNTVPKDGVQIRNYIDARDAIAGQIGASVMCVSASALV